MFKVSVIVPLYNAALYIERCAESLMKQTLSEVEYIFINDSLRSPQRRSIVSH